MADPDKCVDLSDIESELCELDHAHKDRLHYLMSNLKPKELLPSNDEADDEISPIETKKKQKKRTKSKKNKPTGFEESYVDVPLTPEEYEVEKKLYDGARPVTLRLQDALVRYTAKRRMNSERKKVFEKYLAYGGVDVGPRMFGGVDERDLSNMTKDEKLAATAQVSISLNRSKLEINFDLVVRGFLTSFFLDWFVPDTEEMCKLGTVTIKNFLNYLVYHDVCPEYNSSIHAARNSCDIAQKELWNNHRFLVNAPGDFNKACSYLFAGFYFDQFCEIGIEHDHVGGKSFAQDKEELTGDGETSPTTKTPRSPLPSYDDVTKIVKLALAGAGSDQQAVAFHELVTKNELEAVRVEDIDGFEVTNFDLPDEELHAFYKVHASELDPAGILRAKAYRDPGKPKIDMYPEEQAQWENEDTLSQIRFEFFLEGSLLKFCYPGMKVITPVWRLNCGVDYFDKVLLVYSSIYTVLPNDLMIGWKEPRPVLSALEKEERNKQIHAAVEHEERDRGYQEEDICSDY